jgi:hypothetical protein
VQVLAQLGSGTVAVFGQRLMLNKRTQKINFGRIEAMMTTLSATEMQPTLRQRARVAVWRTIASWLPRSLCYFCAVRLFSHASVGKWAGQDCQELTFVEALRRWNRSNLCL